MTHYMNLASLSLNDQKDLVQKRGMNASDLAEACYRQIERLNPILNAFITVIPPEEYEVQSTGSMPLHGIPIAAKDLYDMQRHTARGLNFVLLWRDRKSTRLNSSH